MMSQNLKCLLYPAILLGLVWGGLVVGQSYLEQGKFLTLDQAKKRWGEVTFSASAFKAGSAKLRASMTYDLIKRKTLIGKKAEEIKNLLGPTSGYFWSDRIPTYFIEEGWNEKKDSWQIVFLVDEAGVVKDVKIHKNCCD